MYEGQANRLIKENNISNEYVIIYAENEPRYLIMINTFDFGSKPVMDVSINDDVVFEVGDWQQGFTTIKVPRDQHFDLNYRWTLDGVAHTGTLKNLSCAPATLEQP